MSIEDPPGSTVGVTVFNFFLKKTTQNTTNGKGYKGWFSLSSYMYYYTVNLSPSVIIRDAVIIWAVMQ